MRWSKCNVCGHIQECCAPPCEKCQSIDIAAGIVPPQTS